MQILKDEINKKVQININPKDYFISRGNEEYPYGLSHKIDMSYAGKPDQCSTPFWLFGEKEYQKLQGMFDEYGL